VANKIIFNSLTNGLLVRYFYPRRSSPFGIIESLFCTPRR